MHLRVRVVCVVVEICTSQCVLVLMLGSLECVQLVVSYVSMLVLRMIWWVVLDEETEIAVQMVV